MAENWKDWYLRNRKREDVQQTVEERKARQELQRQEREAKKKDIPGPSKRRSLRKPREYIFIHPETGEYMWTRAFAIKRVGFSEKTFIKYRRNGWIPPAYRHPKNNWELFTARQISLMRRLYKKNCEQHANREEFRIYIVETWNEAETSIAIKPEKRIARNKPKTAINV